MSLSQTLIKVVHHHGLATALGRLLVVACLATSVVAVAHADDDDEGELQVRPQSVGPYLVSVLSGPDSPTIGQAVITVVVTDPTGHAVPDVNVDVETTGPGQPAPRRYPATHDNALNEQTYAAFVDLPLPGRWSFTVHVDGAGAAAFHWDVGQPRAYRYAADAPSAASARLRLTPAGSTPGLIVSGHGQARLLIPAGALAGSIGPERVQVFLRTEPSPSTTGVAVQGNVYRVDAVSLADGQPVPEPWSAPLQLTLRVPAGGAASGMYRLQGGAAVPVAGSVVDDACACVGGTLVRAAIDRSGEYLVGDGGP